MAKETTATTKMGKLDTHLSSLWVLAALFVAVFVTICIYVYAGKQSDLPAREFPDTTIKGDLTVDGNATAKSIAFSAIDYKLAGSAITTQTLNDTEVDGGLALVSNRAYLSSWASGTDSAITLPVANVGDLIAWQQTEVAGGTASLIFTPAGGAGSFDTTGPIRIINGSAEPGGVPVTQVIPGDTAASTDNTFTLTVGNATNSNFEGNFSCMFYCQTPGVWSVAVRLAAGGDASAGTLAFSLV